MRTISLLGALALLQACSGPSEEDAIFTFNCTGTRVDHSPTGVETAEERSLVMIVNERDETLYVLASEGTMRSICPRDHSCDADISPDLIQWSGSRLAEADRLAGPPVGSHRRYEGSLDRNSGRMAWRVVVTPGPAARARGEQTEERVIEGQFDCERNSTALPHAAT